MVSYLPADRRPKPNPGRGRVWAHRSHHPNPRSGLLGASFSHLRCPGGQTPNPTPSTFVTWMGLAVGDEKTTGWLVGGVL